MRKWFDRHPAKSPSSPTGIALNSTTPRTQPLSQHSTVPLLDGAKDTEHNEAVVLQRYCEHQVADVVGAGWLAAYMQQKPAVDIDLIIDHIRELRSAPDDFDKITQLEKIESLDLALAGPASWPTSTGRSEKSSASKA